MLDEPPRDAAWLGRDLSRTKLGLALGAGGAKGYAHVAVLRVLENAGYTVDYVSGSSIGAMVGAWIALGRDSQEIEATMREAFRAETIDEIFKLSLTGGSTGLEAMTRLLRETTDDKTFADLVIPFVAMTVDLNAQAPAPVTDGPLWEALLAATALAGMFPPQEQDGKRLVDGLALVPVPTDAVSDLGADVTVAVNIISRQTLAAWPGEVPADEPTRGRALAYARHLARSDGRRPAGLERTARRARRRPDHAAIRPLELAGLPSRRPVLRSRPPGGRGAASRTPSPSPTPRRRYCMAAREFTFEDAKNILVNRIGVPEDTINDPSQSFEDLGLDSLAFVEIQLAMQQEYGFQIPDEDAEHITTIREAIDYTNKRLSEEG